MLMAMDPVGLEFVFRVGRVSCRFGRRRGRSLRVEQLKIGIGHSLVQGLEAVGIMGTVVVYIPRGKGYGMF